MAKRLKVDGTETKQEKNQFTNVSLDIVGYILTYIDVWEVLCRVQYTSHQFCQAVKAGKAIDTLSYVLNRYPADESKIKRLVARYGRHLRRFDVWQLQEWMLQACPNLTEIEFCHHNKTTEQALMQYATNRTRPSSLSIKLAWNLDVTLTNETNGFGPRLECRTLVLQQSQSTLDSVLQNIRHLRLEDQKDADMHRQVQTFQVLLKMLQMGHLEGLDLDSEFLKAMSENDETVLFQTLSTATQNHLQDVRLGWCHSFPKGKIIPVLHQQCPSLTRLSLTHWIWTEEDFRLVSSMTRLRHLYLENLQDDQEEYTNPDFHRLLTNRLDSFELVSEETVLLSKLPAKVADINLDAPLDCRALDKSEQPVFTCCTSFRGGYNLVPKTRKWTTARVTHLLKSFPNVRRLDLDGRLSPFVLAKCVDQGSLPKTLSSVVCRFPLKSEKDRLVTELACPPLRSVLRTCLHVTSLQFRTSLFKDRDELTVPELVTFLAPVLQVRLPNLQTLVVENLDQFSHLDVQGTAARLFANPSLSVC